MKKTILSLAISSLSLLSSVHAATDTSVVTASVQGTDEVQMSNIDVGVLDPGEAGITTGWITRGTTIINAKSNSDAGYKVTVTQETQSGHNAPTTGDNFYLYETSGSEDDRIAFYLLEGPIATPTSASEPTGTKLKQGSDAFNFGNLTTALQTKEYTFVAEGNQLDRVSVGDYTTTLTATLIANK